MTGLSLNGQQALLYATDYQWPVMPTHFPVYLKTKARCSCSLGLECSQLGKHPLATAMRKNGLKDALLDPSSIEAAWRADPDANVSIITGRRGKDGLMGGGEFFAIDIDNKPGQSGLDQWDQLQSIYGKFPDTVIQQTPSGGKHVLVAYPQDPAIRIGNRRGLSLKGKITQAFPHIDVRGDNGYILAAPSWGPLGNQYVWEAGQSPEEVPLAQLPEAWLEVLCHRTGERPQNSVLPEDKDWPDLKLRIKRARAYLMTMDAAVAGTGGHDQAFTVAFTLIRGFVLPEDEAYDLMMSVYNPICQPPWSEKEIWHKITDAVANSRAAWGFRFEKDDDREAAWRKKKATARAQADSAQALAEAQALARMKTASLGGLPQGPAEARQLPEGEPGPQPATAPAPEAPGEPPPPPPEAPAAPAAPAPPRPAGEAFRFVRGDETELAEAILSVLDTPDRPITFDEEGFWRYAGDAVGVWEPLDDTAIENVAMQFARDNFAVIDVENEKRKPLRVNYNTAVGARKALRAALLSDPARKALRFIKAWRGIAFGNGFLCMGEEGDITMLGHHKAHMCRYAFPFHYLPEAPHPLLDKALEAFWSDVGNPLDQMARAHLLQEYVGGCLFGLSTSFQVALILFGTGNNGKSQVLDFARACFPPGSVASVAPQDFGKPFQLVPLIGAQANFVDEVASSDIAHSSKLKTITAGGSMSIDRKNKSAVLSSIVCGHIFNCNELPTTIDFTEGFFRRFLILTFTRVFSPSDPLFTRDLGKRIAAEEQQGLVSWAIAGAARLLRQGDYTKPTSSAQALDAWKKDVDPVRRFVVEADDHILRKLHPSEAGWRASEMFEHFTAYCKVNGFMPMSSTKFGTRLGGLRMLERLHTRTGAFWRFTEDAWTARQSASQEASAAEEHRLKRVRLEKLAALEHDAPPDTSSPEPSQTHLTGDEYEA